METEEPLPTQGDIHTQQINTDGGTAISGNVDSGGGDFVGRDKIIHGDKVTGDKISVGDIINSTGVAIGAGATANVIIQQTFSETDIQDQNNRRVLRQLVRKYWVEGVLEHSLNHEAAIRLNLADRSTLVENRPWKLLPQQSDEPTRLLPAETHILDVFDQMNQCLLILGEPGAGKTTLLIELARALLKRADETAGYPSPVVFNLSSWVERKAPLAEWLVDELRTRYTIPKKMAQAWVAQDKLLPLLDGLDEVQSDSRDACVQAINQFRQEHLLPLVICSRVNEYVNLTVRLKLQGAVLLQPLTTEQIDAYLNRAGLALAAVRATIQQDSELEELTHSPLTLSLIALAYQDVTPAELNLTDATQTRRQHLFNAYIQRMFVRREIEPIYSSIQTIRWLQWLAKRLIQSGLTIFLIERMQPNWMQASEQKRSCLLFIMLLGGPLYGLIFGLIDGLFAVLFVEMSVRLNFWMNLGLIFRLSGGLIGRLSNVLIFGLTVGLIFGLIFGLIDGFSGRFRKINPIEQSSLLRRKLKSELYEILFWGLGGGLTVGLLGGVIDGLGIGMYFGLIGGLLGIFREIEMVKQLSWSWQRIKSNLYFGLIVGLIFWLIGVSGGRSGVIEGLAMLILGLIVGLLGGLIGGLIFQPSTGPELKNRVETQTPNQGIRLSIRYALVISLIFGLLSGLIGGLIVGTNGLFYWLIGGLNSGLFIGLIGGLIGGLVGSGADVMKHCLLRLVFWWQSHMPWNYARFLDYATGLIFLRKVGGGYIFVHRLIMEHFAALSEEEIEQIANTTNKSQQQTLPHG